MLDIYNNEINIWKCSIKIHLRMKLSRNYSQFLKIIPNRENLKCVLV